MSVTYVTRVLKILETSRNVSCFTDTMEYAILVKRRCFFTSLFLFSLKGIFNTTFDDDQKKSYTDYM